MRLISLILIGLICLSGIGAVDATRTAIHQTDAVADSYASNNAWLALSSSTGHYLNYTIDGKQLLLVNTTTTLTAWPQNITVECGIYWREALGDAVFTLPTNKTFVLGPFESSRFKQDDECLYVDTNATRGKIIAINLPY
jgi:hypothetical protein